MALESRDVINKPDLCFKLHNVNKICDVAADGFKNTGHFLASSTSNGLLFVADPIAPKLRVFFVSDLVKSKATGLKVLARTVTLPSTPKLIACNCDGTMLAVNYMHTTASYIQIYSVPSFVTDDIQTVYNIRIMPDEVTSASQILWNTAISNMLAAVLDNGYIALYQLKDGGILESQMHQFPKTEMVQCACWSPKGKQIVLGFKNGKLQQFKHDLSIAKTILCPPSVYPMPFDIVAVKWLSAHQFIVAYVHKTDANPSIFIVNTGKGDTPATYIRYVNVCTKGSGPNTHQVHFTQLPLWNIMLVSSGNSWNIDIMSVNYASSYPTWKSCKLRGNANLEIPQSSSSKGVYPIGVALDMASTHQLTLNDQVLPPMPMIHFLSTQGQLVSYDFVNLNLKAPRLCSQPPLFFTVSPEFRPIDKTDFSTSFSPLLSEKAPEYKPPLTTHEILEVIPPAVAPLEMIRRIPGDAEAQVVEENEGDGSSRPCWKQSFITTPKFLIGSAVIVGLMFSICIIIIFGVIF